MVLFMMVPILGCEMLGFTINQSTDATATPNVVIITATMALPTNTEKPWPTQDISTTTPEAATVTYSATPTITPTTQTIPMVSVSTDTNCRTGPGNVYDRVGGLLVGETVEVLGICAGCDYYIIDNPDDSGTCWLWGRYATVTGDLSLVPQMTPPPTPTPTEEPTEELYINLVPGSTSFNTTPTCGVSFMLGIDVRNIGTAGTTKTTFVSVGVYKVSSGQQIASTTGTLTTVGAGDMRHINIPLKFNKYYGENLRIKIKIDSGNIIAESNEDDNSTNVDFTLLRGSCE